MHAPKFFTAAEAAAAAAATAATAAPAPAAAAVCEGEGRARTAAAWYLHLACCGGQEPLIGASPAAVDALSRTADPCPSDLTRHARPGQTTSGRRVARLGPARS